MLHYIFLFSSLLQNCTNHFFEILLMLLGATLLGWLLRGLLSKEKVVEKEVIKEVVRTAPADDSRWRATIASLEGDKNSLTTRISTFENDNNALKRRIAELEGKNNDNNEQVWQTRLSAYETEIKDLKSKLSAASDDAASWQLRLSNLETTNLDLTNRLSGAGNSLQLQLSGLEDENSRLKARISELEGNLGKAIDDAQVLAIFGKKIKQDDLKIVEGIGPVFEGVLHNAGIKTWYALSQSTFEELRAILDAASDRYRINDPTTWPEQARLADIGAWKELKDYQDQLNAGRES